MSLNYLDFDGITKNENGEFDGIDVLVQMARQGKIDPWAIDIVKVADMFSAHLFQSKAQNLRYSSRVILYAAILLKMKADILDGIDIMEIIPPEDFNPFDDENPFPDDIYPDEQPIPTNNVATFEEVLQRRTSVRLNRNRVVTLRDLVRQLEFYAKLDKKMSVQNATKRAKMRTRNDISNLTTEDMVNLAHDEDYKLGAEILKNNLTEILTRQDRIELKELTLLGMDKITAFISLLFLVQEGDYSIESTDFYGDIYVVKSKDDDDDEDMDYTEEITNEMIVKSALTDDIESVVDNVIQIHDTVEVEEYEK